MRTLITLALLGIASFVYSQTDSLFLDLGAPEQFFCPGASITLEANTNGTELMWSTGETTPGIVVNNAGVYILTVSDGTQAISDSVTVEEITGPPEITIYGPDRICGGSPDTLTAVAAQADSFLWNTGVSGADLEITEPDIYTVVASNACGDTASADLEVRRLPLPDVEIYSSGVLECPNDRVILSVDTPYGLELNWSDGSNEVYTSVSDPGIYWVEATNDCGTDMDTISIETVGKPYPELSISADKTLMCEGDEIMLRAVTNTNGFLVWSTGYVAFDSIVVDTPGVYEAFFINDCGRVNASISISGPPELEVGIDAPEDMCEGSPETLMAYSEHAQSFEWADGTTGPQFTTTIPGTYTVTATGICGKTSSASHYIAGVPYPIVEIIKEEELICDGARVTLIAEAEHADEYEWSTGASTPELLVDERGLYGVTVRNRCFEDSDEFLLPTVPVPAFVPNAFSPNNDDINDFFLPNLACPEASDYRLQVFSRWGELVFESRNLNDGWNGRLKSNDAPRGVYVWMIDFQVRDREYHLRGDVMLVR